MRPIQILKMSSRPLVKKVMIITSGSSFTVPSDWNSSQNSIHCIGAGASGTTTAGGGGGSYARKDNVPLTPGASQVCNVGVADSNFDNTYVGTGQFSALVSAQGANGTSGGVANNNTGDVTFSGGNGIKGGGGAAGPDGAGGSGSSSTSGSGGSGDGGTVAGGAGSSFNSGSPGANGVSWTDTSTGATAGSGGGGGATSRTSRAGGDGGLYGGGGGAGVGTGGVGANGVIVLEWWA